MTRPWWVVALAFLLLLVWLVILLGGTEWLARWLDHDIRAYRDVEKDVRRDEDDDG